MLKGKDKKVFVTKAIKIAEIPGVGGWIVSKEGYLSVTCRNKYDVANIVMSMLKNG